MYFLTVGYIQFISFNINLHDLLCIHYNWKLYSCIRLFKQGLVYDKNSDLYDLYTYNRRDVSLSDSLRIYHNKEIVATSQLLDYKFIKMIFFSAILTIIECDNNRNANNNNSKKGKKSEIIKKILYTFPGILKMKFSLFLIDTKTTLGNSQKFYSANALLKYIFTFSFVSYSPFALLSPLVRTNTS